MATKKKATPESQTVIEVYTPMVDLTIGKTNESHHITIGQIMASLILGLKAYELQDGGNPSALLDPAVISGLLQGVLTIFPPKRTP